MKNVRLIGDVHGRMEAYLPLIKDVDCSIQVGDFGWGFCEVPTKEMRKGDHKALRGNHDSPALARASEFWIPDGAYHNGFFCVGGAESSNYWQRQHENEWWPDEELTYAEFYPIVDTYRETKPDMVITHDCPDEIKGLFLRDKPSSITSRTLQFMLYEHRPKLHVFGHMHQSFDQVINGTRFVCLNINETLDIQVP